MKRKLAIIGSGDLGQLIAYYAEVDANYDVVGFFDDYQEAGLTVNNRIILGSTDKISALHDNHIFDFLIIAIGYKHFEKRSSLFLRFKNVIPFATIIHSTSIVDKSCIIGNGSIMLPGCILDRNVNIGENVFMNVGCCIAHDSFVRNHTFLAPRVAMAGFSSVGECCNIGVNTTIIDNVHLSNNIQTGGGTVVIKTLNDAGLYVGNPARFLRSV